VEFRASPGPTVGVEWELQLLDSETLDLVDGIVPLMEFYTGAEFVKPEYIQSCVELNSAISANSDEAIAHLSGSLSPVLRRCAELDMRACGSGTHPFCRRLALITPLPRYLRSEQVSGYLAHTQITFSTHVHVGMSSGDQAMHTMSLMIPAIPVLIAFSANAPFWRGHVTGHASYRHRILAAAPNYGLPPRFRDWAQFRQYFDAAIRSGTINGIKDIHWDVRPHPDFGTLEVRVMDAASDLRTVHGLVAFARLLVLALAESDASQIGRILPLDLPAWMTRENRYRASHLGLDADYIMDSRGSLRPMRTVLADLLDFCRPAAGRFNECCGLAIADAMAQEPQGWERQVQAYAPNRSARAAVEELQRLLADGLLRGARAYETPVMRSAGP